MFPLDAKDLGHDPFELDLDVLRECLLPENCPEFVVEFWGVEDPVVAPPMPLVLIPIHKLWIRPRLRPGSLLVGTSLDSCVWRLLIDRGVNVIATIVAIVGAVLLVSAVGFLGLRSGKSSG